jgi:hypothetical protein
MLFRFGHECVLFLFEIKRPNARPRERVPLAVRIGGGRAVRPGTVVLSKNKACAIAAFHRRALEGLGDEERRLRPLAGQKPLRKAVMKITGT